MVKIYYSLIVPYNLLFICYYYFLQQQCHNILLSANFAIGKVTVLYMLI